MKVIVYGTLKKGGRLSSYLRGADFLTDVYVSGFKMYDTGFGYPFIMEGKEGDRIWGEKYEVDERTLETLDMVEGVKYELFKRLDLKDLKPHVKEPTYIYVSTIEKMSYEGESQEIESGRWDVDRN